MLSKMTFMAMLLTMIAARHLSSIERDRYEIKKHMKVKEKKGQSIEYLDGILHYRRDDKKFKDRRIVADIENDFRRSVAMEGMKYIFKRGLAWRTLRRVLYENGTDNMITYKCNNLILENSTDTNTCGLWTIEENLPCPYEIYSLIDKDKMCGYDYLKTKDYNNSCPAVIKFGDLSPFCDNPMETRWRFTTEFRGAKKYNNYICDGKDYCEVFTMYSISQQHVVFRIINTTNNVIYSRIMKPNNITYVCVTDCGIYDPNTKKVRKPDTPLRFSLIPTKGYQDLTKLKTRHHETVKSSLMETDLPTRRKMKSKKFRYFDQELNRIFSFTTPRRGFYTSYMKTISESTTVSICQQLRIAARADETPDYDY